jgi:hypothetical protein
MEDRRRLAEAACLAIEGEWRVQGTWTILFPARLQRLSIGIPKSKRSVPQGLKRTLLNYFSVFYDFQGGETPPLH